MIQVTTSFKPYMGLPNELFVMILKQCDGPTIITCKQTCKRLCALAEGDPALQRATFGRLPQNVMIKIVQCLAERDEDTDCRSDPPCRVLRLESLNRTYEALLNRHPTIKPIVFRGGNLYSTLEKHIPSPYDVQIHPILSRIGCEQFSLLKDIRLRRFHESTNGIELLKDSAAFDDYLTTPPTTTVYFGSIWGVIMEKISNKDGITVRDFMEAYCSFHVPGRIWDRFWASPEVHRYVFGCPLISVHHDS